MDLLAKAGRALISIGAWPGRIAAWLLLPMLFFVIATVVGSLFRLNEVAAWGTPVPLFGDRLNVTGLAEMQWHLFAVFTMLGGAWTLARDGHVNVDILSSRFSPRTHAFIRLVFDLTLLLPFCVMVAWYSTDFFQLAWQTDEQSDYGGLTDRWIVKLFLPLGFVLLVVVGIGRLLVSLATLVTGEAPQPDGDETEGTSIHG